MALAIMPTKKKKVTLTNEQTAVANPMALTAAQKAPLKAPMAPSPPKEAAPIKPPTMVAQPVAKPALSPVVGAPAKAAAPIGPAMTTFSNVPSPGSPLVSPPSPVDLTQEAPAFKPPLTMPDLPAGPRRTVPGGPLPGAEKTLEDAAAAGAIAQTDDQFDEQVRKLMGDLLAGRGMDVSTAEEEKLIQELMQDRLGQQLVEQRARMGRAGFGASGALAAMESDAQRAAAQQATRETLAVRRQAEQEAIDNALRAIGVDVSKREQASQSEVDKIFMDALLSSMGMSPPTGEEQTARQGGSTGEGSTSWLNTGWGGGNSELATAGNEPYGAPGSIGNPTKVSSAPEGTRLFQHRNEGDVYTDGTNYYIVSG